MARATRALESASGQRVSRLPPRLLEREEVLPVALPPWALDPAQGECTTLILLAPVPTQFVVRLHPWPGLPSAFGSRAGAFQLTRCGRERATLLPVLLELRSPRAVVHALVAVGPAAPPELERALPERSTGPAAPLGEPGPAPAREPAPERVRRFEQVARRDGALALETLELRPSAAQRLPLEVGCHRLLAIGARPATYRLVLRDADARDVTRLEASEVGDLAQELCVARERLLSVELEDPGDVGGASLAVARFPLPRDLPGRFGPQVAERLAEALGASSAPRRLGTLVATTIGAQGRTSLPRPLLPGRCYLAAVTLLHGQPSALSLAVTAGAWNGQASSAPGQPGTRLGFCTGQSGRVELDVEARGLGVAWLVALFHVGPATVSP